MQQCTRLLNLSLWCTGVRWNHWTSNHVRSTFINYFKNHHGHHHVPSSPVVPWTDPSLDFVNAGMNQFKSVFMGESEVPYSRAISSQKCIRVGGKHNDLAQVGRDTYHHTFFEMLGSWSFGDYFKKEACEMAWQLLTEVYQLPASRLYVTYFGGDATLGLTPDLEVRDIWRAIGVSEERVIPFGMRDNFWEMGDVGPCGPCTEIHYDHLNRPSAAERVNLGVEDMIELWNIVFIQYERLHGGGMRKLGRCYVDTGMGLERITAVLNSTTSNYDTDLFTPIFSTIQKLSGCREYSGGFSEDGRCLDTAYRTLADYSRMVTVSLADGAFPQECYKLWKILRRALIIGSKHFNLKQGSGMGELAVVVAETLATAHPELLTNLSTVTSIIAHEEEDYYTMKEKLTKDWRKLLKKRPELSAMTDYTSQRIIEGVENIAPHIHTWKNSDNKLPGAVAFNLYKTFGINTDLIHDLAGVYGLTVDEDEFHMTVEKYNSDTKERIKRSKRMDNNEEKLISGFRNLGIPLTNDSAKYDYESSPSGSYRFPQVTTKIMALLVDGKLVEKINGKTKVGVVLEATNFYHEAGGQETDTGTLSMDLAEMEVENVQNVRGYLIHWGTLEGELSIGDRVVASVCEERRLGCMQHHTATHLLNTAIKSIVGLSRQTSSHVGPGDCLLQLQTYQRLGANEIQKAQDLVKKWISAESPINRTSVPFQELLQEPKAVMIPGQVYPQTVHVISTNLNDSEGGHVSTSLNDGEDAGQISSFEPCCGTHLHNTAHLKAFVIENVSSVGNNYTSIRGLCGAAAVSAEANAEVAQQKLKLLHTLTHDDNDQLMSLDEELQTWWKNNHDLLPPYSLRSKVNKLMCLDTELHTWWEENNDLLLPYSVRSKVMEALNYFTELRNTFKAYTNAEMRNEVQQVIDNQKDGAIVHLIKTEFGSNRPRLVQAHKLAKNRAMLFLVRTGDVIVGRSAIPEDMVTKGASATDWLECVRQELGGKLETPKDTSLHTLSNYRSLEMQNISQDTLQKALQAARSYIDKFS